ncbi:hypothetical protein [Shimia ponticola]|uniref:hypothetical protein n=1 Tax=Shimia ponticola TaxID=2582893 RepID=UPI0011BF8791|nr:hypothetical protein [Shimia ponticola]
MRHLFLVFCLVTTTADATVIGGAIVNQHGNGQFVKLSTETPFAVGADTFNTDHLYAFDEDQNITLIEPLRIDIGNEGGMIPAGTVVASHYVFFDSLDGFHMGHVDFHAPILGVAAQQDTMAATDFLANTQVTCISTGLRGLERGDLVWIDEDDPHRLWVSWAGSSPGDYIRVFTEKSPALFM